VEAERCLVVIEAVEAMAEAAANALLKTLEEPGDGLLILLTAAPDRLLSTIRSRCQAIPFTRLAPEQLQQVLAEQGFEAGSPDPPELVELAAGSPGALLLQRQHWQALPEGLTQRCAELVGAGSSRGALLSQPVSPVEALSLARDLCEALEVEQQLWLLDWWQLRLWRLSHNAAQQQRLEQLRRQLRSFVQPRLAWEVALLELSGVAAS
jgi:DNA polymerase-3 subunit delta'